jgi:hypothetical protein
MDIGDNNGDLGGGFGEEVKTPRALPDDLPKSLDDRRNVSAEYAPETEMYDAWQGRTVPVTNIKQGSNIIRTITIPDDARPSQATRVQEFVAG